MSTATAPVPETSTGPDVVIGVDTHKHTHMAVALSANGGWLGSLKLEAKRSGYRELLSWVATLCLPWKALAATAPVSAVLCRRQGWTWWK